MYSWPTTPTVDVVGGAVPMMGSGAFLPSSMRISLCAFVRDELIEELVRTYVEQYNGDDTL